MPPAADIVPISNWRGEYGEPRRTRRKTDAERAADLKRALDIRRSARLIAGTPGEKYLRSRSLMPDVVLYGSAGWPSSVRWADDVLRLPIPPVRPGIVIDVRDLATGAVTGIHRIIFRHDGSVDLDREGNKKKRGLGAIWGNAALLDCEPDPKGRWGIAEGVETAMAARQLYRIPVWVAIFGGNMRAVTPPRWAKHVTIFADADPVNPRLGYSPGFKFATEAMQAYRRLHWIDDVRILAPDRIGDDFADVLAGIAHA